jgi:hypothetical protein
VGNIFINVKISPKLKLRLGEGSLKK